MGSCVPGRAGGAGTAWCLCHRTVPGGATAADPMQVVPGWILCSGRAAAHVLGSLLSSQSMHLQTFDNKKIIWVLFVLLQLLALSVLFSNIH